MSNISCSVIIVCINCQTRSNWNNIQNYVQKGAGGGTGKSSNLVGHPKCHTIILEYLKDLSSKQLAACLLNVLLQVPLISCLVLL